MPNDDAKSEMRRLACEFERIGQAGAKAAQEESRRLGVPNVYSIDGQIYYELPNGELSLEDPYVEPAKAVPLPSAGAPLAAPNQMAPKET